jgi:hypothetical protein
MTYMQMSERHLQSIYRSTEAKESIFSNTLQTVMTKVCIFFFHRFNSFKSFTPWGFGLKLVRPHGQLQYKGM